MPGNNLPGIFIYFSRMMGNIFTFTKLRFLQIVVTGLAICWLSSCSRDAKQETTSTAQKPNPVAAIPAPAPAATPADTFNYPEANAKLQQFQKFLAPYKFEDFRAQDTYTGKAAPLDLASHIDAALYQKTLTRGLMQGANFAGHYTLVTIDCGKLCQENYVIDTRTGKLCDKVTSALGISFRPNSNLLLVNVPDPTQPNIYQTCPNCEPLVYVLKNDLLYKARLVKDKNK